MIGSASVRLKQGCSIIYIILGVVFARENI